MRIAETARIFCFLSWVRVCVGFWGEGLESPKNGFAGTNWGEGCRICGEKEVLVFVCGSANNLTNLPFL